MDLNYRVGNRVFNDKFQAASEAHRTHSHMYFNLFDQAFSKVDWSVEPPHTWDQLLDMRARQLASKNRPIVLHFSGGTDSYTIYKVFERNRIHLSALVMNYRGDLQDPSYVNVHKFLQQGVYDPHCEIIYHNYLDHDSYEQIYSSPDWCWTSSERHQFGIYSGTGNGDDELCVKFGQEVISVLGTDKPRLMFDRSGVYSYQDDIVWIRHMKSARLDSFYITDELPELHVKQSWMLKKYLQHKFKIDQNFTNFHQVNAHYDPTKFEWLEYCAASGRYGDLANSNLAHIENKSTQLYIPSSQRVQDAVYKGRMWKDFERLRGTKTFSNYIDGILDVANDGAGQYLKMSRNNLSHVRSFYSKAHRMPY